MLPAHLLEGPMTEELNIIVMNEQLFDAELEKPGILLVKYWAEWCNPCKTTVPLLVNIFMHYRGKVRLGTIDVDECHTLVNKQHIISIPVVQLWKDGGFVDQIVGQTLNFEEDLKKKIDRCLE